MKAEEKSIDWKEIEDKTLHMKSICESLDVNEAFEVLKSCVDDWQPSSNSATYLSPKIQLDIDSNSDVAEC